jgi:hypothetical protein
MKPRFYPKIRENEPNIAYNIPEPPPLFREQNLVKDISWFQHLLIAISSKF